MTPSFFLILEPFSAAAYWKTSASAQPVLETLSMDAEEDLQLLLRTWQQGQLLGSPRDFDRRVRKSSDVGMHGFSLSQRCRALG